MATQNSKSCEHIMVLKHSVKGISAEFIRALSQLASFSSDLM